MEALLWVGGVIAVWYVLAWRFKRPLKTYGTAAWASLWKVYRKGLFRPGGLLVGDWYGLSAIYYRGNGHVLTIAPTGVGKGATAIIPNLLRYDHLFVCDFGGENTAVGVKTWRKKGLNFYCLNPWGMHTAKPWDLPSHSVNPLDLLNPDSETFVSDADLLAEMIIARTGKEGGSSAYFKDEAQSGIKALLMHIVTAEPVARRNLLAVREYISLESERWGDLLSEMKDNPAGDGVISREAAQLERRQDQAPEEFSAILSTMKQDTNFLDDPIVRRFLSRSDANLSDVKGHKGCVVSFVMPLEHAGTHSGLTRLILGVMLVTMQRPPLARHRVLFVLDEFASLGRVSRVSNGLATLRKYRVWLWPIFQSIGQIRDLYGAGWEGFISNAELKQFFGAWDNDTGEYISKLCGDATVETVSEGENGRRTKSHGRRRLITPEEVMKLEGKQVAIIGSAAPMLLETRSYWERPSLRDQFYNNPYHGNTPRLPPSTPWRALSGAAVKIGAWALAPGLTAMCLYLAAVLVFTRPAINTGSRFVDGEHACDYVGLHGARSYTVGGQCPSMVWRFNVEAD
ncbi:MAG: type IV secretory system conjugative DNA transfer family protein [Burkholderiales bacterium]|nr:type IV secretory system conjugative DNA transfer family protein [Burkholderiales bacterium]